MDDKFEEFFDEYNDENLGGLDCEEIEGCQVKLSVYSIKIKLVTRIEYKKFTDFDKFTL